MSYVRIYTTWKECICVVTKVVLALMLGRAEEIKHHACAYAERSLHSFFLVVYVLTLSYFEGEHKA